MPGYELYGEEERAAILEWFDSNNGVMFAHGFRAIRKGVFKVRDFERAVAQTVGARHAQAVSSGSAALLVALRALGLRPGDEVITQAFTFVATVEAIIEAGGTPVITEVDHSLNMDPTDLEARITPRTKVVIPVHMGGAAADMDNILRIARAHNLLVLEDAAQAFGGTYKGKHLGTLGDMGAYSFDFAKAITTGEGGMIVTDDTALYESARAYHDHGHEYNPKLPRDIDTRSHPGFNFRMTEIQAVLGLTQLKKLEQMISAQRKNKAAIKAGMASCGFEFRHLHDPEGDTGDSLIFFLDSERQAQTFAEKLGERGLDTKNVPNALAWHFAGTWQHLFGSFPSLANPETLWPRASALLHRAIALPVNVKMSQADIEHVIESTRRVREELD